MKTIATTASHQKMRDGLSARFSRPLLSFFLRRVKNRAQAEDLTQEVLFRIIQAAEAVPIEYADRYVFRVAINLLRDGKRRALRAGMVVYVPLEEALDGRLESQLVEERCPERVLAGKDALSETLEILGHLSDLTRKIFISFRVENMKQKDVAALYGIALSTVEKHVAKAVLHLATNCGRESQNVAKPVRSPKRLPDGLTHTI
jgi:RNA polymerase sigma factor (sigma-70 family)